MDPHSSEPDSEESSVDKDYDDLEEAIRKLPPERQEAFEEMIDEQENEETEDNETDDAGGSTPPSDP